MTYLGCQRSSACRCPFFEPYSAIAGIGVAMIVFTVADIRRNPFGKRFARGLRVRAPVSALKAARDMGEQHL